MSDGSLVDVGACSSIATGLHEGMMQWQRARLQTGPQWGSIPPIPAMTTDIEHVTAVEVVGERETEAREALQLVRTGLANLWEGLARMVACKGWEALGYTSFRRWCSDELHLSLASADLYLKKTKKLMYLSETLRKTVAELEPTVPVRGKRRPQSQVYSSMRTSVKRLRTMPALVDPLERRAASELRDQLNRLLDES